MDFCTKYGSVYEIISVNSNKKLESKNLLELYKLRAVVSDYAHNLWKDNEEIILPLRAELNALSESRNPKREILDN